MTQIAALRVKTPTAPPVDGLLASLRGVGKDYATPAGSFMALQNIDLDITAGRFIAIVGKSGSGKTTIANLLTGIDSATSGSIRIGGVALEQKTEEELTAWRGRNVGVVFQFFQLLPTLTVVENVMLPMDFCRIGQPRDRRPRAMSLLAQLGIAEQADKLPSDLSGGQQQRAAIARALVNDPQILVADEPTGKLDSHTTLEVMELFRALTREGRTVVMVTHERDLGAFFTETVELADGQIVAIHGGEARS
ncbi:MAG: ABC transporter ATP-binding protein [Hoeflea sp.]|uniref:ABC transporter ATP-binding protein n=1 Tax=Hoeflea sp. TaxID=1940281 RepID=UPI00272F0A0D|nr:ABC transporter ATP-binding protein [Hoeflea sp.]MDP2118418.1 ABC transporter ATP-binding protein [Hoeflea sp.]